MPVFPMLKAVSIKYHSRFQGIGKWKQNCLIEMMKTNGRMEERLQSNLTTNIKYRENVYSGEARNISKNGLYIEAIDIPVDRHSEIQIMLAAQEFLLTLRGEIIWHRSLPCKSSKNTLLGIGIRISEAPPEYLNFVEYLKYLNRFNN